MDGETSYEGRVEVCHSGQWGTICQFNDWGYAEARVVCRQLGLPSVGKKSLANYAPTSVLHNTIFRHNVN